MEEHEITISEEKAITGVLLGLLQRNGDVYELTPEGERTFADFLQRKLKEPEDAEAEG